LGGREWKAWTLFFGYSTKHTELWSIHSTFNHCTRNILPPDSNIVSFVLPGGKWLQHTTQFWLWKVHSLSFEFWKNVMAKCVLNFLHLCCYMLQQLIFVTSKSQVHSQNFVHCWLWHTSLSSSLYFWFPLTVKHNPLKHHRP
jgi:hypothetical protein